MPHSRIYPFGEPQNDGEKRVIRYLDQNLPSECWIYHSLERQGDGQTYEWDVIVLTPHAIFCLEVKDWPGRIIGNDRDWLLDNGAVRHNPYPLIAKKSKILKSRLLERNAFLGNIWVEPLVVIADDKTQLALNGDCALRTVTLIELVERLTDEKQADFPAWVTRDIRNQFTEIERILVDDFQPLAAANEIAHFRLLEPLNATALYTEWRAENRFAAQLHPVRLKIYVPDPYLSSKERDEQLRAIQRDFEAAGHMGSHPHIQQARDFFPDEGGRYILVLDDIPGEPLAADLLANRSLTFEYKLVIVEDIADGLAHAHARNVIHRDVRPGNILLTATGAVLVNFDCARIGGSNTIHHVIELGLDPSYLAPEVQASVAAATAASDVYALGIVLYELLTGRLPDSANANARPSTFDALIDQELDQLVIDMIATEPSVRPTAFSIRDALARFRDQYRAPTQAPGLPNPPANISLVDFSVDDRIEGQYLVREVLGEGSYGKVYRVFSAVANREYAMKVFRDPGLGLQDAQKEFRALSDLSHPHIARVYIAAQLRQGAYYLLTDCIIGESLQQLLDIGRLAPMDALRFASDLLEALSYLHSHNYVHRDVKPSNIIVSPAGATLIDFSIAAPITNGTVERVGTPAYIPPDVVECGGKPSRDLFALGVVLYESLIGLHPYDSVPRPGSAPHDPRSDEPLSTDALTRLLRRAVAPKAIDRYATADEFLADLRNIEEPFKPLPPRYPLAQGITISEEERTRPNYNPYLTRFLTLYSQNEVDNSGTRGYDEVSRATYVRTRLDKRLIQDILTGKFTLVIITGNAGDGKTAFLQKLEEVAQETYSAIVTRIPSGNGASIVLNNRTYRTNYDGSQNEGDIQNDDVLADFFNPFKGEVFQETLPSLSTRLIAINEGKLRDFLARRQDDFPWLSNVMHAHLEQGQPLPEGYLLVNLNNRSVTSGSQSILDEQIKTMCDPAFWVPCRSCKYASRCPVKFNVDTLNHPDLGPRVRQRIVRVFQVAQLRERMHLTMRGIRSTIAYFLFGEEDCTAIASALNVTGTAVYQDEMLLQHFYYNAIMASKEPPSPDEERTTEETDRLLYLLSESDVGLGANPADDRDLYFEGRESPLLPRVVGRGDYDSDLMQAMAERLASNPDEDAAPQSHKRLHAMMRRKAFFERSDDGWEAMLPYSQLRSVLRAVEGKAEYLAKLKSTIISGINHGEGLSSADNVLVLRLARGVPGQVQSFRQFPASDFILLPGRLDVPVEYLENSSTHLELIYRPNGNGSAVGRPTLRLDLDLIELLARMARGYVPTAAEWRGPLVNLQVFRTLLAHEPYTRLTLVDMVQERRFELEQQGTKIVLSLEGRPNGTQ